MNARLAEVIAAGMKLNADDREVAAVTLQRADDANQAAIDNQWRAEVSRRLDEVLTDEVELIDAAEHTAELRSRYRCPRK